VKEAETAVLLPMNVYFCKVVAKAPDEASTPTVIATTMIPHLANFMRAFLSFSNLRPLDLGRGDACSRSVNGERANCKSTKPSELSLNCWHPGRAMAAMAEP
jgi:hypothetical protein